MFLDEFVAEDAYLALSKVQGGLSVGSLTGTTRWVDNSDSSASDQVGRGALRAPFATIDYAIGQCDASKGDVVLVKPGHDEIITSDAAIDLDVIGVSVIGLGWTTFRPTIRFQTNTTATIEINAAGCRFVNMRLSVEVDALAKCFNITATGDGAEIRGCQIIPTSTAFEVDDFIVVNAADDVSIIGNEISFSGVTTPFCDRGIYLLGACPRAKIIGNYISGEFTNAVIDGDAPLSSDIQVLKNMLVNTDTTVTNIVTFSGSSTGIIAGNKGFTGYTTDVDACFSTQKLARAENYFSNAPDETGKLIGTVSSP